MRKILPRIDWASTNFLTFVDMEGVTHNVLEPMPKWLKRLIKRDWHAKLAKEALSSFVAGHSAGMFNAMQEGDRLDMYHNKSLLNPKQKDSRKRRSPSWRPSSLTVSGL